MKIKQLNHRFVEFIPEQIEPGKIYISKKYQTAIHQCCCGCGKEVVTPLTPTDWCLRVNSGKVSLYPSIGNWSLPCKSHYWIRENKIIWGEQWSKQRIERGRKINQANKIAYYEFKNRNKESNLKFSSSNKRRKDTNHTNRRLLLQFFSSIKSLWHKIFPSQN